MQEKEYKMLDENSEVGELGYRDTSYGKTECRVEEVIIDKKNPKVTKVFRPLRVKNVTVTKIKQDR